MLFLVIEVAVVVVVSDIEYVRLSVVSQGVAPVAIINASLKRPLHRTGSGVSVLTSMIISNQNKHDRPDICATRGPMWQLVLLTSKPKKVIMRDA
jgi:hypothetical protein